MYLSFCHQTFFDSSQASIFIHQGKKNKDFEKNKVAVVDASCVFKQEAYKSVWSISIPNLARAHMHAAVKSPQIIY